MAAKKPRSPPAEPLMHGIYCHRYYTKNRGGGQPQNARADGPAAGIRRPQWPPRCSQARLEARRAAAKRYRERSASTLPEAEGAEARAISADARRKEREREERRELRREARRRAEDCGALAEQA
ncbi:hypothetical protein B0H11DRAFT_2266312 [Mycena galericulata]|nr:hypothetical protein B0H11DRAFT_2266312 [Mycena galericulata]